MTMMDGHEFYKGTITGFSGSWMSGLGILVVNCKPVNCDNAPTVRALEGAFGDTIGENHAVREDGAFIGKRIVFSVDPFGLLDGFTPEDDWNDTAFGHTSFVPSEEIEEY